MSVNNESQNYTGGATIQKTLPQNGVYASLFNKINLTPVAEIDDLNGFEDNTVMAETSADARVTAAVQVFMQCLQKSGQKVAKLDKTLLDHHIAELDFQISRQLDEVMHSDEFQKTESVWRGLKSLVDKTDFRQNVKIEILDLSKDELRQDFEDSPEIIQSGLYRQTYTMEYDTPGSEPIAAVISAYEFDASAQDVALMRNISKVSAAAHMPFIGSAGPAFFLKENMEQVAAIKDISNYFDRAEYIKWKSFRETDDARYQVFDRGFMRDGEGREADAMNVSALQDITVASGQGSVKVNASKELILSCGGAYIKLSGGNIELGCPGNILLKAANVNQTGPASLDTPPVTFPKGYSEGFITTSSASGAVKPFTTYKITTAEGGVYEGISGAQGETSPIFTSMPSQLKIEYPRNIADSQEGE